MLSLTLTFFGCFFVSSGDAESASFLNNLAEQEKKTHQGEFIHKLLAIISALQTNECEIISYSKQKKKKIET